MKKLFFLVVTSILFFGTIFAQRTNSIEQYKKLAGRGKTNMQINDSTVKPVLVKWNRSHKWLKIREYDSVKTIKGDVVKASPAPAVTEKVVVTTTIIGPKTTVGVDTVSGSSAKISPIKTVSTGESYMFFRNGQVFLVNSDGSQTAYTSKLSEEDQGQLEVTKRFKYGLSIRKIVKGNSVSYPIYSEDGKEFKGNPYK